MTDDQPGATDALPTSLPADVPADDPDARRAHVVATLTAAFADLIAVNPVAFRSKFRKMAADPFAFYRGSACLFYADVAGRPDRWADERTSRVWIQGDLHAENFGTYMDGEGSLVFDVNDFDEAYLGHFTWDLRRFVASLALLGWSKALPDAEITRLVRTYLESYLDQVQQFLDPDDDRDFSIRSDTARGQVREVLLAARLRTRSQLLDRETELEGHDRVYRDGSGVRRLDDAERATVLAAYEQYLTTIPADKRMSPVAYRVKDVVGRSGFGIGSAGLPAYSLLVEGRNEALDNDIVLSMKQAAVSAVSAVVTDPEVAAAFHDHGHRTAVSQRALQAHADPLLGHTSIDGVGFVVAEVSPYENDLDWSELTEPDDMVEVLDQLGRATAKVHCVSDRDSDQSLVPFQVEEAIAAVVDGHTEEFLDDLTAFALEYAAVVRADHALFVDAFRGDEIAGVRATA